MPTNVSYEYINAEMEYLAAKTTSAKIMALTKMLMTVPKHKGTEKLRNQLKKRLAALKKDSEGSKKSGGKATSIAKEGAAQVVFIGLPNSGKSTVLQELSKDKVRIEEYEFTTTEPEIRMMRFENIWLQGIELPAIYKGFSETNRQYVALIRSADYICIVLDGKKNPEKDLELIETELKNADLILDEKTTAIVYTRQVSKLKTKYAQLYYLDIEKILATAWSRVGKIRIQTKSRGKVAPKPIIMSQGSTVKELINRVHNDFLAKFKHAKVFGLSAKFPGMQVGLNHTLKDGDIVEIFTK